MKIEVFYPQEFEPFAHDLWSSWIGDDPVVCVVEYYDPDLEVAHQTRFFV